MSIAGRAGAAAALALAGVLGLRGGPAALGAIAGRSADIGSGGSVRGDISMDAGDQDLVGIDLEKDARLDLSLASDFSARLDLLSPSGSLLQSLPSGYSKILHGLRISVSGRYHLRVSSADGTQGLYFLHATERWPTTVLKGTFTDPAMTFRSPAGGTVRAKVSAKPSKAWTPEIADLTGPDLADVLSAPVPGSRGTVRLPPTGLPEAGDYELDVGGGPPGAPFKAKVTVKGPKVPTTAVDLANGLTPVAPVSFYGNGVAAIFTYNCSGCHDWAASYQGVVDHARPAMAYIRSGAMPKGGPRLAPQDVALVQSWIVTGESP